MAANYIVVKGYIRQGELLVDLPHNVQDGEVEVLVSIDSADSFEDEFASLISDQPKTNGWADKGIRDSLNWLQQQSRIRREMGA